MIITKHNSPLLIINFLKPKQNCSLFCFMGKKVQPKLFFLSTISSQARSGHWSYFFQFLLYLCPPHLFPPLRSSLPQLHSPSWTILSSLDSPKHFTLIQILIQNQHIFSLQILVCLSFVPNICIGLVLQLSGYYCST